MFETSSQYSINVARGTANRCDALGRDRRRPLRDRRRIVENPDAAAVRAEHQILRARMDDDVVVSRRRKIRVDFFQCAPLSWVTNSARSVPANSTFGFPGNSARLRTDASSLGRPSTAGVQVLPKSVVLKIYGAKSPSRCASNDTYAVPARRCGCDDVADERAVLHAG